MRRLWWRLIVIRIVWWALRDSSVRTTAAEFRKCRTRLSKCCTISFAFLTQRTRQPHWCSASGGSGSCRRGHAIMYLVETGGLIDAGCLQLWWLKRLWCLKWQCGLDAIDVGLDGMQAWRWRWKFRRNGAWLRNWWKLGCSAKVAFSCVLMVRLMNARRADCGVIGSWQE